MTAEPGGHFSDRAESKAYAHTLSGRPEEEWQSLEAHLHGVADLASSFGREAGMEEWARLAGLWHDLGKYSDAFQVYLRSAGEGDAHMSEMQGKTDHSTGGAQHAVARFGLRGHLLAYPIAGHHSGLLDGIGTGACLEARLLKEVEPWTSAPAHVTDQPPPELPSFLKEAFERNPRDPCSVAFFTRMLFSCLVDADFLDTEAFMNPLQSRDRPSWPADIVTRMGRSLRGHIDGFDPEPTEVNLRRAEVLEACRTAAQRPPGLFSLTVPTGGGKTLSSLSFALDHAVQHGLRRVIYVIPFTSIIEQSADVFRKAMSGLREDGIPDPVVEHHSSLDPEPETATSRLAAENWDAPLIVTTGVQFYESLFANRSSRCRKLHNLARSVIILDEAQTLPVDYLHPCLKALDELQRNYGSTIVLCTATQPAVHQREGFPIGLRLGAENEIVPEPEALYRALKRVKVEQAGPLTDAELADRLRREEQVLCIVNTRGHARRLSDLLEASDEHVHLSALMCPAHRSARLAEIRSRLDGGHPCRVVSTRLIEAGVDIDFPVVYRSLAGLDSIAQAAGRCNRNGTLPFGSTVVFEPEAGSSEAFLADTAGSARQVLPLYDDPLSLEAVEHYFRLYYWDQSGRWDAKRILNEFQLDQNPDLPLLFGFRRAAERFRIIEETGRPVIVPWGKEGPRLCEDLRNSWETPPVRLLRKLQRYTVQVPARTWEASRESAFEIVHDQYAVLYDMESNYSDRTGLILESRPPGALIA